MWGREGVPFDDSQNAEEPDDKVEHENADNW